MHREGAIRFGGLRGRGRALQLGARRSRRFNVESAEALDSLTPPAVRTLKRRKRRAPSGCRIDARGRKHFFRQALGLVSTAVAPRTRQRPTAPALPAPTATAVARLAAAPARRTITALVPALLEWFAASARAMPWRQTHDPYAVWVSEIMLQQTQVKTVIPYWERWMRDLPDVAALAGAPAAKVLKLWEGLGYYSRARNLHAAAQLIVEKFGGRFPHAFPEILELPGIGRYTAGAIASIAYNQPAPILDGNVMRVLTRVFGIDGDPRGKATNQQLWALATHLVEHAARTPDSAKTRACSQLNQSLMELGALVCTPRQPACPVCPARKSCIAHRDQRTHELPALAPRAATTARRFVAFVITRAGRHLVQQRPSGGVNAGLWEFPNLELAAAAALTDRVVLATGRVVRPTTRLGSLTHSITRYRITVEIYRAELWEDPPQPHEHWVSASELEELALTSAHRKIVARMR